LHCSASRDKMTPDQRRQPKELWTHSGSNAGNAQHTKQNVFSTGTWSNFYDISG